MAQLTKPARDNNQYDYDLEIDKFLEFLVQHEMHYHFTQSRKARLSQPQSIRQAAKRVDETRLRKVINNTSLSAKIHQVDSYYRRFWLSETLNGVVNQRGFGGAAIAIGTGWRRQNSIRSDDNARRSTTADDDNDNCNDNSLSYRPLTFISAIPPSFVHSFLLRLPISLTSTPLIPFYAFEYPSALKRHSFSASPARPCLCSTTPETIIQPCCNFPVPNHSGGRERDLLRTFSIYRARVPDRRGPKKQHPAIKQCAHACSDIPNAILRPQSPQHHGRLIRASAHAPEAHSSVVPLSDAISDPPAPDG